MFNLESMREIEASFFGWAETNTNWNQEDAQAEYREKASRVFQMNKTVFSSSDVPSTSKYKPGGTAMTLTVKWCGRAQSGAGKDPSGMGRWSYMVLEGKNGKELLVITAYRVSQVSMPQHGEGTTYHQEHMIMSKTGNINPNPRKQFILDMIKFIQDHQGRGREILLVLDANKEVGKKSQGITALVQECSLYDILATSHPDQQTPVTFDRGSKTINYTLGSQRCKEAIPRAGVIPFYHRIQADHRAIYVDFDGERLFGGNQSSIVLAKHRTFTSNNPAEVAKYLQVVTKYWRLHNMSERIEKLHENMKDKEIQEVQQDWESLDKEIGRVMKIGEKALKKPSGRYSWSKTLRRAAYTQQYWKKRSKLHKYGIEETEALDTKGKSQE